MSTTTSRALACGCLCHRAGEPESECPFRTEDLVAGRAAAWRELTDVLPKLGTFIEWDHHLGYAGPAEIAHLYRRTYGGEHVRWRPASAELVSEYHAENERIAREFP